VYDGVVQNVDNKRKRLVRLAGPSLAAIASHSNSDGEEEEDDELELADE
jgi:hypothetical protein